MAEVGTVVAAAAAAVGTGAVAAAAATAAAAAAAMAVVAVAGAGAPAGGHLETVAAVVAAGRARAAGAVARQGEPGQGPDPTTDVRSRTMRLFERLVLLLSYLVGTVEPRSVGGSASKMFFGRANRGYSGDNYELSDMCNGLAVLVSHRQFCDMLAVRELARRAILPYGTSLD